MYNNTGTGRYLDRNRQSLHHVDHGFFLNHGLQRALVLDRLNGIAIGGNVDPDLSGVSALPRELLTVNTHEHSKIAGGDLDGGPELSPTFDVQQTGHSFPQMREVERTHPDISRTRKTYEN